MVGWATLMTDLKGLISLAFSRSGKPEILWICVGNKDRSYSLLKHLINSMVASPEKDRLALSVADCGSTDIPDLESEIRKIWTGELIFSSVAVPFERAAAFNRAVEQAGGELVFICDADVSIPGNLAKQAKRYVSHSTAWFPVCQWQLEKGKPDWKWFSAGTGLCAFTKTQLRKTGMLDTAFKDWGKEDWDLFFRCYRSGIMPLRSRCSGLYHHWHPPSKPADYVNMF